MNSNAITGTPATQKKASQEKRTYTFKQKLLPSILLSLAIPLTVCVFGPFDIYLGNMAEFRYSLTDFLPLCAVGAIFFAGLFFGFLMLLRGKAYEIACAVFLSSSLLMVAQRAFMNMGVTALVDGGSSGVSIPLLIINALIWVLVIGGAITATLLVRKKHGDIIETVTIIAMITVIGMQAMSMVIYSVSSDVWMPISERKELSNEDVGSTAVLNFDGFSEFATENNVVVFIVDRFDSSYYDKFVEQYPDFFTEKLDGFTYFEDYTTLHSRTYPAVASILTQKENDFTETRIDYFKSAYADGGAIKKLSENGYSVNLYTKEYYAYDNAAIMEGYVDNIAGVTGYYIDEHFLLAADMVRLAFSDYLPFAAKWTMGYMKTSEFNAHAKYTLEQSTAYDSDLKAVKDYIEQSTFETSDGKSKFTFIHLDGCHTPLKYDESWNNIWSDDTDVAILLNFEIIFEYIQQMKDLGVYDDATIVITGDHAWSVNDEMLIGESEWKGEEAPGEDETDEEGGEEESAERSGEDIGNEADDRGVRVTSMFFKRSGDSGTDMETSSAQISQDELWNTIFESEGLLELKGDGPSFFDIPEGEERERRYFLQVDANFVTNQLTEDQLVIYKITGSALDPENWEIVESIPIGSLYK